MNREPIQFLPVDHFWEKKSTRGDLKSLLAGVVIGVAVATALFLAVNLWLLPS
ncbi:MAG: hypothetical protein KGL39_47750 [Patescibacteria group bacterium]|nr:hypothetical protein [Patescibacteria group bacterium]